MHVLGTARADPTGAPGCNASAVPDRDWRPLHFAIRVRNEFNSGCTIDGCDAVAAQEGNPWRRTGLRCIIGGECTERVVADCRANRLAGGAFWEGDTVELAEGAECRIICPGPGSRRAIRAATMATQGAQEITGTGGLRPVPRKAAQVHTVPATGRKGDGELVRRSGRQQALQADAAVFGFSASRVGWRPVSVLAGVRRGRSGGHGQRGARGQ